MISWFLSIYPIICCSEALVSFRPLHVFQQWLWPLNVSFISRSLSSSVSHVWSCQVNLPTSQIGLCHCLAMKSILTAHTLQRKRQALHGTLRDFQGMIFCLVDKGMCRISLVDGWGRDFQVLWSPVPTYSPSLAISVDPHIRY